MKIKLKKSGGDPSGNSGDTSNGENGDEFFEGEIDEAQLQQYASNFMASGPQESITRLLREKYQMRAKLRSLRAENEELREHLPEDGGATLTAAEAVNYQAYLKLGTPEEIQSGLTERESLSTTVSKIEKEKQIKKVMGLTGYDNQEALSMLIERDNLPISFRTETKDGQAVEVPYVTVKDNGADVQKPLTEYAGTAWKPFLASLKTEANASNQEAPPVLGPKVTRQPAPNLAAKQGDAVALVDSFTSSRYKGPPKK